MADDGMRVVVTLEGGDALIAALRKLQGNVKRDLRRASRSGADVIGDKANGMAPGPHVKTDVVSASETEVVIAIGPDLAHWYYRFHELGAAAHEIRGDALLAFEGSSGPVITPRVSHPGMAAEPFLRPAHDTSHDDAPQAVGAILKAAIDQVRA